MQNHQMQSQINFEPRNLLIGKTRSRLADSESSACSSTARGARAASTTSELHFDSDSLSLKLKRDFKRFEKTYNWQQRLSNTSLKAATHPSEEVCDSRPTFVFDNERQQRGDHTAFQSLTSYSDVLAVQDEEEFWHQMDK